ncbi:hypothetical protein BCR41DRAFT_370541 [Lobosporangium transversale]|uniref:Peptide hydrolase n=1 Tax=Lobosporangium transversale TaxID=64571 RepID=A0A1Y2GQB4_9FUNG|nr:hypothetical protein BCR41DRAFT_370541 [Lobosporangium transversale]ORZ16774.1 hypothetical protein BCR41DRAFT_370541 [Lobosporangium transversale]|eukprot:XP_021881709.1 hypothetical protein BCR41DRAFT_370541 [Lobosporangium transversale]
MTDTFGPRITGSDALEKSIDWVIRKLKADNLSVTTEEVVVDYWQRHQESLHFLSPTRGPVPMHILGLGYSVSTPDPINGLEAEVIVVHSKDELEQLGQRDEVRGKIVLWNNPFTSYTENALYRAFGAVWAQGHGAVASLVRSVTPFSLQTPHTGVAEIARIPMAAISVEDADLLERSLNRHKQDPETFPEWPKVKLIMGASTELESKISRNIIIELKGREKPEEIVVVGGHIDSWDVGSGAVDDGAGCFIAWETLRQLSRLERPPRRTVRVVFWTAEENTSAGGVVYARNHPEKDSSRHVFAFESDTGVFDPYGISFAPGTAKDGKKRDSAEFLTAAGEYFMGRREDLGYPGAGRHVLPNPFGADIEPLCKRGVACAEFVPADPFPLPYSTSPYAIKYGTGNRHHEDDMQSMVKDHNNGKEYNPFHNYDYQNNNSKKHHHHRSRSSNIHDKYRRPVDTGYFYYHHSEADSMGAFTPDQLKRSAAVMAIWTYIAAESPIEF